MVELYSLKLLGDGCDLTGIDQDVAQLEFESSVIEQSLFSSMALDPSLISTDSLDLEKIRERCETNKNDYKLMFEDSGQWTTSTLPGGGTDTSEIKVDNNFTTWGRIKSSDLPFDDKTNSLPELRKPTPVNNGMPSSASTQRPASLVANFVERQPSDYTYAETYLGDGRYVDVNDNEIGFVPPSTAGIQKTPSLTASTVSQTHAAPLRPPRRTFADLESKNPTDGGSDKTATTGGHLPREDSGIPPTPVVFHDPAPDLKFLSLPFELPSFCLQHQHSQASTGKLQLPNLMDVLKQTKQSHLADYMDDKQLAELDQKLADFDADSESGFGSAASSSGPSHIEDWPSLAFLLPKHVVDACGFFQKNSHYLTGSTRAPTSISPITAPRVPRSTSHTRCCPLASNDSGIDASSVKQLCSCQTQSLFTPPKSATTDGLSSASASKDASRQFFSSKLKLHARELSMIGLPHYAAKRNLVERVVEGVAEIARGASSNVLCVALEALLADGLNRGLTCWDVIVSVTAPGPATSGQGVYQVVKQLNASEKPVNSRSQKFFNELLRLKTLDGWLSYVILKENVLSRLYSEQAFVLGANTAYRSLFWRMVESLELLTVIEQRHTKHHHKRERGDSGAGTDCSTWTWGSASRLASDSRVPKSSSVPSKLAEPVSAVEDEEEDHVPEVAQVRDTPTPKSSAAKVTTPVTPTAVQDSSTSTSSTRPSRIPVPSSSANSSIHSSTAVSSTSTTPTTTSSMAKTPTPTSTLRKPSATATLLTKAASPTRLPLFRRSYGSSRTATQPRPFATVTPSAAAGLSAACRYETRRPTTTPATNAFYSRTRRA